MACRCGSCNKKYADPCRPSVPFQDYFKKIVPRLLDLLKAVDTPTMYGRPLSLALTKLLKSHPSLVLVHLHGPFIASNLARQRQRSSPAGPDGEAHPSDQFEALCVIVPLVLNAPPSPMIHDRLLTPIMSYLLALHWHLQTLTTADPILRTHVRDICLTWGRAANELNVQDVLRRSVFGGRGWRTEGGRLSTQKETVDRLGEDTDDEEEDEWHWVGGGQDLRVVFGIPPQPDLSTPPQAGPSSAGPDDFEQEALAMLDLQPPPNLFVDFVQGIKRTRPAGQLFIDLLGRLHRPEDDETPENPFGDLLLSKVVMRMAEVMGEELAKGEEVRILEFVNLVLRPSDGRVQAAPAASAHPPTSTGLGMTDLRIVKESNDPLSEVEEDDGEESELDSDDEVDLPAREDAENMGLDDGRDASGTSEGKMGIIGTAVGLLIAVLQGQFGVLPLPSTPGRHSLTPPCSLTLCSRRATFAGLKLPLGRHQSLPRTTCHLKSPVGPPLVQGGTPHPLPPVGDVLLAFDQGQGFVHSRSASDGSCAGALSGGPEAHC